MKQLLKHIKQSLNDNSIKQSLNDNSIQESLRINIDDTPEVDINNLSGYEIVNNIIQYFDILKWSDAEFCENKYLMKGGETFLNIEDLEQISKGIEDFILQNHLENYDFNNLKFFVLGKKSSVTKEYTNKYRVVHDTTVNNILVNNIPYNEKIFSKNSFYILTKNRKINNSMVYYIVIGGPYGGLKWCEIKIEN